MKESFTADGERALEAARIIITGGRVIARITADDYDEIYL